MEGGHRRTIDKFLLAIIGDKDIYNNLAYFSQTLKIKLIFIVTCLGFNKTIFLTAPEYTFLVIKHDFKTI
jgi:hypothetical protein